ncbi:MAG: RpiB/LacA/LacB family sugar-phosphate isomerase, partial [Ktedonobacterales bacterium]
MKIAIGSDERTHLTDMLVAELQRRGHEVQALGPLAVAETTGPSEADWPLVSAEVAQAVAAGEADAG